MVEKMGFLELYSFASAHRAKWFNPKWRLAVIVVAIAVSWITWQYLLSEYPQVSGQVVSNLKEGVSLGERVFSWFAGGMMFGALLYAVMLEGEFILGTRKLYAELASEFKKVFGATNSGKLKKSLAKRRL
ncbi:TPA: hypothetical protein HA318_04270 [Candidatus Micrarchaeota archaeon]|nr:MAG: hypothetical protein AUJ65_01735 [Candidatus Micrarchaeota archaeon CG1_02_51_15]HII39187.1 hypothetical protein [Candidatus Micrarchaeota archaeon]